MEEYLNLRKKREFGEVFNATFLFLKQEYKLFGKAYLYYVLPVTIVIGIISSFNQMSIMGNLKSPNPGNPFAAYSQFMGNYLIIYGLYIVNQAIICTLVYNYIGLYIEKGSGNFVLQDIFAEMKNSFFKILMAVLLSFVMIIVGTVCCIIPGIYLGVSLSLLFCIMVIEKKNIGEAISRSFELTRIQWWWTFLILFVSFIIIGLITYMMAIPLSLYGVTVALHKAKSLGEISQSKSAVVVIYSSITTIITSFTYVIPLTVIAFQYFNLLEIKEMPSLMGKIDQMSNEDQKSL